MSECVKSNGGISISWTLMFSNLPQLAPKVVSLCQSSIYFTPHFSNQLSFALLVGGSKKSVFRSIQFLDKSEDWTLQQCGMIAPNALQFIFKQQNTFLWGLVMQTKNAVEGLRQGFA